MTNHDEPKPTDSADDTTPADAADDTKPTASVEEPKAPTPQPTPAEPEAPRWQRARWFAGAVVFLLVGLLLGRLTSPEAPPPPAEGQTAADDKPTVWTCSMHPQIRSPKPGKCPICGMDLIPVGEGGDDSGPRELKLQPNAVTLAEIETEPVRRRDVARDVRMVGKVDYDETRLNYITAWIPGRLDRMYVDYTGTLVRKDDHLVEIYSPQLLSAQEELLQAIEARKKLQASSSRLMLETADQTVASAREKLRLWGLGRDQIEEIERSGRTSDHITIRAPIGGIVVHKNKNTGDYVNTGERVYTIADLSQVWVQLDAYESDLPWVRYGQTVQFETESYPGVPFEGRVVFVDPVLTGNTRTVKVRLNVTNADGRLKPGMFVRAVLKAPLQAEGQTLDPSLVGKWICPMHWDVIKDAQGQCDQCGMPLVRAESLHRTGDPQAKPPLVVPASAVLWTGVRSLVYVKQPGDQPSFRGQEIVLGPRAGDFYVVRAGLSEGDLVVTKGAFKIDSALQIEARPSMMLPPEGRRETQRHEATPAFLAALRPVYEGYLAVQEALAGDDLAAAKTAASTLATAIQGVDMKLVSGDGHMAWMREAKRLRDAAEAISTAESIDAARASFADLAEAALDVERQFGHAQGVYREAFCPMARDNKGASWLQRGEEVQNPFFGASMLRCGEVRSTFPARGEEPQRPQQPATPAPTGHEGHDHATPPGHEGHGQPPAQPESPAPSPTPTPGQDSGASLDTFRRQLDGALAAYFNLQRELAEDKATGATRAPELRRALEGVDPAQLPSADRDVWRQTRLPGLLADVKNLEQAAGLEAQRQAFEPVSTKLTAVVSRYGHLPQRSVRRFHCPMAFGNRGADWLQEGEQVLNPYFGSRMLRCGRQVESIPASGRDPAAAPPADAAPTPQPSSRPAEPTGGWTCSMHPQIRQPGPGKCPICGMNLVPVRERDEKGGGK